MTRGGDNRNLSVCRVPVMTETSPCVMFLYNISVSQVEHIFVAPYVVNESSILLKLIKLIHQ